MSDVLITFACSHCTAQVTASADQVGRTTICLACHSQVLVPDVDTMEEEDFRLSEGVDQPQADFHSENQAYIPVVCSLCETRMYGTFDQIGQKLRCPDCGRATIVRPPPDRVPPLKPALAPDYRAGYDVLPPDETHPPPDDSLAVTCSVCHADLPAGGAQPGQTLCCRLCGAFTVVPTEDSDELLEEPAALARSEVFQPPELITLVAPRVFSFPFDFDCAFRLFGSATVAAVALILGWFGFLAVMSVGGAMFGVSALVLAALITIGVFIVVSQYLLAILGDTSEGVDVIESWPDGLWIDWAGDSLFILNSLALSAIPGFLIGFCFGFPGAILLSTAVSMLFLFPIILLSMQEANSAFQVFSYPVLRSLVRVWRAWLAFYGITAVLVVTTAVIIVALWGWDPIITLLPILLAGIYTAMVYFRILGRLTRFIESVELRE